MVSFLHHRGAWLVSLEWQCDIPRRLVFWVERSGSFCLSSSKLRNPSKQPNKSAFHFFFVSCELAIFYDDSSTLIVSLFFFFLYRMKDKGYEVSDKGVSIKTSKRFDRQDYIDATQRYVRVIVDISLLLLYLGIDICLFIEYRNMMKTMNATSFNRRPDGNPSSPSTQATLANASTMADRLSGKTSGNSGDKKSVFSGLRKSTMWEIHTCLAGWWLVVYLFPDLCVSYLRCTFYAGDCVAWPLSLPNTPICFQYQ